MFDCIDRGVEPCAHPVGIGCGRIDAAEHPPCGVQPLRLPPIYVVGQEPTEFVVFHDGLSFSRRKMSRSSFTALWIRTLTAPTSMPRRSAIASSFMPR